MRRALPSSSRPAAVLALAAAGALLAGLGLPRAGDALEVAFYLLAGAALWSWPPLRRALRRFPAPHRAVSVGLIVAMVGGQFDADSDNFPFVSWRMYGKAPEDAGRTPDYLRLRGVTADGRRRPIWLSEIYSFLGAALSSRVARNAREVLIAPDESRRRYARARLERLLRAVAEAHNRRHPEGPLTRVEVWRHWVRPGPGSSGEERVLSMELEPA